SWRRRDVCNFQPPAFVYVGILRNWNESRFCLWAVLWLRKCLFRFSRVDVRSDLFGARINNSSRNETRKTSNHCESIHLRRNIKMKVLEGANHELPTFPMTLWQVHISPELPLQVSGAV